MSSSQHRSGRKSATKQPNMQNTLLNSLLSKKSQQADPSSGQKSIKRNILSAQKDISPMILKSANLRVKLVDFLIKAAQIQRKLQIIKQTLCQEQQFHPASVFHRIDTNRKGYLQEKDIQRFMNDNKMQYKGSQLKILYGKMNVCQSDTGVKLWEFQNFILPNQNPKLRYLTMRRPVYVPEQGQRLNDKIQWLLSKLFVQIMKEEVKLKQINVALISTYDFNSEHVFNMLANSEGFITGQSLNNFMVNSNYEISIQEVGCLIRLIDKHGDGRIYLKDFKFFLATLGLKKEHQIFDELSPIPALKNYADPLLKNMNNRQKTLKQRVSSNNIDLRSPQKAILSSSRKVKKSSISKRDF